MCCDGEGDGHTVLQTGVQRRLFIFWQSIWNNKTAVSQSFSCSRKWKWAHQGGRGLPAAPSLAGLSRTPRLIMGWPKIPQPLGVGGLHPCRSDLMSRGRGRATRGIPRCGGVGAGPELGCTGLAGGARCIPKPPRVLPACPLWLLVFCAGDVELNRCIWAYFYFIIYPVGLGAGPFLPRGWDKPGLLPAESGGHGAGGEGLWDKVASPGAGSQKGSEKYHQNPCPLRASLHGH